MREDQNLVVYNDGELELKVSMSDETIWLTQKQIAELFSVTVPNINMHIKAIYKDKELVRDRTIQYFLTVQKEGSRMVERNLEHYNLDMIISVGYRVNSITATKFRQWATSVLKSYIYNGYAINGEKITHERFVSLENEVSHLRSEVNDIKDLVKDERFSRKQGIFYDAQIYDAYDFINTLLKSAKSEVVLIDNYIDESVFTLFSKYQDLRFTIHTNNITK